LQWSYTLSVWLGMLAMIAIGVGSYYSLRTYNAGSRLSTDVLNPITIGEAGALLFILATSITTDQAHLLKRLAWRGFQYLIAALGLVVCVLSASKGPIVGVAAIIVLLTVFRSPQATNMERARGLFVLTMVAGLVAAGAAFLSGHGLLALYERFSEIGADQSTAMRLVAWRGALGQFDASPLLGDAFVENYTRFYPHNDILEAMMTTGIVGLVLLMVLLLAGLDGVYNLTRDLRTRWIAFVFVQQLISGLVSGSLYFSQRFWLILFCVVAIQQATECSRRQGRAGMARDLVVPA
jgi:O-antigen ligase